MNDRELRDWINFLTNLYYQCQLVKAEAKAGRLYDHADQLADSVKDELRALA